MLWQRESYVLAVEMKLLVKKKDLVDLINFIGV